MSNSKTETDLGDEVMKAIGGLANATSDLKAEQANSSKVAPEEVGSWITVIGKALLSIFK